MSASRGEANLNLFAEERAYIAELSEKCFGQRSTGESATVDAAEPIEPLGLPLKRGDWADEATNGSASTDVAQSTDESQQGIGSPRACSSLGTMGHPELCSRPCLFYNSGRCSNGINCEFCHMPHDYDKKAMHLSKKHRSMLGRLPQEKAMALVWSAVKEKVLAFDSAPATLDALARLAASCPGLEEESAGLASSTTSMSSASGDTVGDCVSLSRGLRSLNTRRLIFTLELVVQIPEGSDPDSDSRAAHAETVVAPAAEELVSRLRAVMASRA